MQGYDGEDELGQHLVRDAVADLDRLRGIAEQVVDRAEQVLGAALIGQEDQADANKKQP